jgi:two-component system chemotaxis response regulator CheB
VANRDVVVIGASAGGIEALQRLLGTLPVSLPAAVLIVLHTGSHAGNRLAEIFQRSSPLRVVAAQDGAPLRHGTAYVAQPDSHLLVDYGLVRVIPGPRENRHRPAIDPLFRSAGRTYGPRAIGVVLTGMLDDGSSGLMLLRSAGGQAIVQDPATAMFPSMPENALARVPDAHVVPLESIGRCIVRLTQEPLPDPAVHGNGDPDEKAPAVSAMVAEMEHEDNATQSSMFGCPECGGVLREIEEKGFLRYRCRVGHAYTAQFLELEQRNGIDVALWSALRALEENAALYRRMAETNVYRQIADRYRERAAETDINVTKLREFFTELAQKKTPAFSPEP